MSIRQRIIFHIKSADSVVTQVIVDVFVNADEEFPRVFTASSSMIIIHKCSLNVLKR